MSHHRKKVGLVSDELRHRGPSARFNVCSEAGRVRLHQAVQRGLLEAAAHVMQLGTMPRPLGLTTDVLHDGIPMG
jgi:hypothetical protein